MLEDKETEIRDKDNEIMTLKHYISRMEADRHTYEESLIAQFQVLF